MEARLRRGKIMTLLFDTRPLERAGFGALSYEVDLNDFAERVRLHKRLSILKDNKAFVPCEGGGVMTAMGKLFREMSSLEALSYGIRTGSVALGTVFVGTGVLMFALGCALKLADTFFR